MPLFKKKKKEDPVHTAKKAEFSGKTKEALQEKDTAPSQIEQETTQPVKKNHTDWYTDMKERSERAVNTRTGLRLQRNRFFCLQYKKAG